MRPAIKDILLAIEGFAPSALAEKWDNVGLLVGSPDNAVSSILIGLDATNTLVDEAIALGADTVITHHPVIFKPLASIDTSEPGGRLLQKALRHDLSLIACHTNLDSAIDGVNDILAAGLGLTQLAPLVPAAGGSGGLGRIGRYDQPLAAAEFLRRLRNILQLERVNIAGELPDFITSVAVCGGSGSELATVARSRGADVYLSAEIKHSTAIWAREAGMAIIDGTHYATEKPAIFSLAERLRQAAAESNWTVAIQLTETEEAPLSLHLLPSLHKQP